MPLWVELEKATTEQNTLFLLMGKKKSLFANRESKNLEDEPLAFVNT